MSIALGFAMGSACIPILLAHQESTALSPLQIGVTSSEWKREAKKLRTAWETILGRPDSATPTPIVEVLEEETLATVVRQRVRFRTEPDVWAEAYLLLPRGRRGRIPGVVVFHSTIDYNMRQPAGLEGPEDKHIGLRLAERGLAALCPRNFIYDYRGKSRAAEAAVELLRRHPRWTGMGKMLWDGRRALDALAKLKAVDPNRLGTIGHSLGAKESLYLAAFDQRIRAAVSSEGGIGLSFSNWDAPWYLGNQIKRSGFRRDHHELLALCAPRPFLLIGGDSADGRKSAPFIESARPAYALFSASDSLSLQVHDKGHAFSPEAQAAAYGWLEKWLKN